MAPLADLRAADSAKPAFDFPAVDQLPDNPMMPDPFKKPAGTRVASLAEWKEQRDYLKAMLEYYLYGRLPPRPSGAWRHDPAKYPLLTGGKRIQ